MRFFVVLALVAFTGCQASVLRSDEPQKQLEQVTDAFWDYVAQAKQTAEDNFKTIRESEFGQQVDAKITDGVKVARQYAAILHDQASVIGQEAYVKVSEQADWLSERLQKDFQEVKAQLEPYTEDLRVKFEQQVETLREEVAPYTESLEKRVKELREQLGPYAEELKETAEQYLEELRQNAAPLAESLRKEIVSKARVLQDKLEPYVEHLKENLSLYVQNIRAQVTAIQESFNDSA
ncbi:apolipoprotein A-I-like [Conger conger]|uniref:apolipoprotein A-I-like n=1 Tax=Conger conger TaxID=82655 RepID=UPI002A598474|nr:apolipoprotein A-I-like [Conger conger]